MKSSTEVVVIGGGCVGASVLYGLARHGCTDAVLLEKSQLTAGSTWHAAGLLVTYVRSTPLGRLTKESIDLYAGVEQALGHSCGLRQVGQLRVANTRLRMDEFESYIGMAEAAGVKAAILTPAQVASAHPFLVPHPDIVGGIIHPEDGYINPADITMGMAKLARDAGASVVTGVEALDYQRLSDGRWKVKTDAGDITCRHLVFATGNYARQNARKVGLDLPCIPIVHQYWTSEVVPELKARRDAGDPESPILRDEDYGGYLREDLGAIQFGPYEREPDLKLFAVDGVPADFGADLLPEDFDAVQTQWERALARVPLLGTVGIRSNTRGPFQMTPDELPLCGPAPGLAGLWLAEGVPGGILWGGTMGERLARWITDGNPGIDMSEIDPRRFGDYASKRWTADKVRETWGTHMDVHVPGEVRSAARPAKTSPSYDFLSARGAVWTVMNGFEMPQWFAPSLELATPEHGFRRGKHAAHVEREVHAVREAAGLLDMSPMAKFTVRGRGAARWLDGLLANTLPGPGRLGLCMALDERGGVISEYTISCVDDETFYLVSSPYAERFNFGMLTQALPDDGSVVLDNVSESIGVLALAGPRAREVLQPLTDIDLSSDAFPWLATRAAEVGYARDVKLLRVSYTGESGWELHHPISYNRHLIELLLNAGESKGLKLFGLEALESLRLDKSYRALRRDLTPDATPFEAGLDRFVRLEDREFVGAEALREQLKRGVSRRLVTVKLPSAETSVIAHEGVYRDGSLIGRVTSGGYSYHFGHDIALCMLPSTCTDIGTRVQVNVHGELRDGEVVADSLLDPANARARA